MNKKTKFDIIKVMAIVIGVFLIFSVCFAFYSFFNQEQGIPTSNYLGLAKLGLIPTNTQCSHSQDTYTSTRIVAETPNGNYAILESKFGDEYCPVRIR